MRLTDVRVFDGQGLRAPGDVVIDGGLLGGAGGGDDVVDGQGGVLLPGLVDAHVHLGGTDDLAALAAHGVTTALDMASWPPDRIAALRGRIPDIRTAGLPAIGATGMHARMLGLPPQAILRHAEAAGPFVAARLAERVDYVKIVLEPPGPGLIDQATADAVVAATHARGRRVVAHAAALGAYRMAVAAGADVVTHAPRDGVLDDETIAAMLAQGTVAVPTLAMMEAVIARFGPPGEDYAFSRDSVTALHAAGVPIVAGTDAFSGPGLPSLVDPGTSLHHELALLVGAGLSPLDAVRAATVLPARHFGLDDRGAVADGLRADLVLLDGDPLTDIAATRSLRRIWCGGTEVAPVAPGY